MAKLWMGDRNHPSIINKQGASPTIDATLNLRKTHPFCYS